MQPPSPAPSSDAPTVKQTAKADRSMTIAAIIMMGSVLSSRVIGLFREIALASFGGTSHQMDAYVTSFILPELLNHVLAGGFLSITFIPIFQRYLTAGDTDAAWKSFSNLFCMGSLLFLAAIPVMMFFTPDILMVMGPHIREPETFALTVKLTRIILPAQLLFYWGAFFSAVQMSHRKFFLPALAPLGYNIGIILGGLLLGPRMGIEGFAWGVLGGAFIGNVLLQLPGAKQCGMRFIPTVNLHHPDVREYVVKTIPLVLGLGMTFSNELFFRFFGSFLPEGGTSSVNYALRTMMIVVAVFGQASGVAFFPFLAKLAAEQKFDEMTAMLNRVLRTIALYLVPLSVVLMVLSRQVIAVLYERGRFDAHSGGETASVFTVYLLGSFAFSAAIIIARTFYAMQRMVLPMVVSTAVALASIPLYLVFSRITGAAGIAIAAVIGMTLQCVILYGFWNKNYGSWRRVREETVLLAKIVALTLPGAILGVALLRFVAPLLPFENYLLNNGAVIVLVALPMLGVTFLLYELTGLQRFVESIRGFVKRNDR